MKHSLTMTVVPTVVALLSFAYTLLYAGTAMGLKDLPDGPRAGVVKELARNRTLALKDGQQEDDSGDAKPGKRDTCNLAIDADKQPARGGPPRHTTTVITGSVIQLCGR
jgi:hypothetical protein